jgi:hypothetical protein
LIGAEIRIRSGSVTLDSLGDAEQLSALHDEVHVELVPVAHERRANIPQRTRNFRRG